MHLQPSIWKFLKSRNMEKHANSPPMHEPDVPAIGYFSLETHLHSDPPLLTCSRKNGITILIFCFLYYSNSSLYKHYKKAKQLDR